MMKRSHSCVSGKVLSARQRFIVRYAQEDETSDTSELAKGAESPIGLSMACLSLGTWKLTLQTHHKVEAAPDQKLQVLRVSQKQKNVSDYFYCKTDNNGHYDSLGCSESDFIGRIPSTLFLVV